MNLNPIIKAKVNAFKKETNLTSDDSTVFEYFVNYHVLYSLQNDSQVVLDSLAKVSIGGGNDIGLDGICIVIDGCLFWDIHEIKEYLRSTRKVEVGFIFIQSKYKEKCDSGEFLKFTAGIKDFLSNNQYIPNNESIKKWLEIKDLLLSDDCIRKLKDNFSVSAYYVYIGNWRNDATILGHKNKFVQDLKNMSFESSDAVFIDSNRLHKLCNENESTFDVSLQYQEFFPLAYDANEADNAGMLLFNAKEFAEKVLLSETQSLRVSLFYDNVRDFQGNTSVNNEISDTITMNPQNFHLLNNGIVVVCDKFNTLGNKQINLVTPQIVNGCQTCNVLYECYKNHSDLSRASVMVKVVSTKTDLLMNKIVRSANKQNIVPEEAFEITREFHKNLEEYFIMFSKSKNLKFVYERRSKQHRDLPIFEKVNFRLLIQSVTSTFLQSPHIAWHHEYTLLNDNLIKNKIFQSNQSFAPYYVAPRLLSKMMRSRFAKKQLSAYKMQVAYSFCLTAIGQPPSLALKEDAEKYCEKLLAFIEDDDVFANLLDKAIANFETAKNTFDNKYAIKDTERFTNHLCDAILSHKRVDIDLQEQMSGYIVYIGVDRNGYNYGFISNGDGDNIFFHENQNTSLDFNRIKTKQVTYTIGKYNGKEFAENVTVL